MNKDVRYSISWEVEAFVEVWKFLAALQVGSLCVKPNICLTMQPQLSHCSSNILIIVTTQVIVNAVLYLKLRKESDIPEDDREKCAERIVDILSPQKSGKMARDSCIQYLLKTMRDLRDVIFTKPLHVRIKLDCLDHPKADNLKDIILTESSIEVNVSL